MENILVQGFDHLEDLDLSLNQITSIESVTAEGLENMAIQSLDLTGNMIFSIGRSSFKGFRSLKLLRLTRNQIKTLEHASF